MSESERVDSCLRVVANRCRNLKKAIERAKTWERAEKDGQQLNDEQIQSVKSIEGKETLLAELQEILRKQTAIVQPQTTEAQDAQPISKRKAKAGRLAKAKEAHMEKESTASSRSTGQVEAERDSSIPDNSEDSIGKVSEDASAPPLQKADLKTGEPESRPDEAQRQAPDVDMSAPSATTGFSPDTTTFTVHRDPEDLRRQMDAIQIQHAEHINRDRKDAIRMTLNLFHVVDFLRQKGSREALLAFFDTPAGQRFSRQLDSLDLDLLCYFNVMLTTPNGNVPHNEAVDVSTAHCLEFLKGSASPAFKGTSYSKLSEIATTIGTCPILTERGLQFDGRQQRAKRKSRGRSKQESSSNGREPSHLVSDPSADVRTP